MGIATKFSNGDKVFFIRQKIEYQWKPCEFCGEAGEIAGLNGEHRLCPVCMGKRGWNEKRGLAWGVVGPLTIGEVRVRERAEDDVGVPGKEEFANYGPQEALHEEEYMCKETGIGSGTLYHAESLFATEAAALEACRTLNNQTTGEKEAA